MSFQLLVVAFRNIENDKQRKTEIEKLMSSPYGVKIEQWLKKYNPNGLSHRI